MPDQVSEIGVKLSLDATSFDSGIAKSTTALNKFQEQASRAGSGVGQLTAGGGSRTTSRSSGAPGTGTTVGVNVSLTITPQMIRSLRQQIISGLGTIPINVTPTMSKTGPGSAQSIIGTVFSAQYGLSPTAGRTLARQAMEIYQPKAEPRARGGPVVPGRDYLVGERRPEVVRFAHRGQILPDAEKVMREREQQARRMADIERRHLETLNRLEMSRGYVKLAEERAARAAAAAPEPTGFMSRLRHKIGRQDGGRIQRIGSLAELERFSQDNPGMYSRWTPSIRADMQRGARSAGIGDRRIVESGISANTLPMHQGTRYEAPLDRSKKYDLGPAYGQWDYRGGLGRQGIEGFARRRLWLMSGTPVGTGLEGEPVLDPTSIRPRAAVSRRAVEEHFRKYGRASGGHVHGPACLSGRCGGGPVHAATGVLAARAAEEAAIGARTYDTFSQILALKQQDPKSFGKSVNWYQRHLPHLTRIAGAVGIPTDAAAHIIAEISSNNPWPNNVIDLMRLFPDSWHRDPGKKLSSPMATGKNRDNIWEILQGRPTQGVKKNAFGRALLGDPSGIPADVWMARLSRVGLGPDVDLRAGLQALHGPGAAGGAGWKGNIRAAEIRQIHAAVNRLSQETGFEPRGIQAVLWDAIRDESESLGYFKKQPLRRQDGGIVQSGLDRVREWVTDPFMLWMNQMQAPHREGGGPTRTWLKGNQSISGYPEHGLTRKVTSRKGGIPGTPTMEYVGIPKGKKNLAAAVAAIEAHNLAMESASGPAVSYMHGQAPPEIQPPVAAKAKAETTTVVDEYGRTIVTKHGVSRITHVHGEPMSAKNWWKAIDPESATEEEHFAKNRAENAEQDARFAATRAGDVERLAEITGKSPETIAKLTTPGELTFPHWVTPQYKAVKAPKLAWVGDGKGTGWVIAEKGYGEGGKYELRGSSGLKGNGPKGTGTMLPFDTLAEAEAEIARRQPHLGPAVPEGLLAQSAAVPTAPPVDPDEEWRKIANDALEATRRRMAAEKLEAAAAPPVPRAPKPVADPKARIAELRSAIKDLGKADPALTKVLETELAGLVGAIEPSVPQHEAPEVAAHRDVAERHEAAKTLAAVVAEDMAAAAPPPPPRPPASSIPGFLSVPHRRTRIDDDDFEERLGMKVPWLKRQEGGDVLKLSKHGLFMDSSMLKAPKRAREEIEATLKDLTEEFGQTTSAFLATPKDPMLSTSVYGHNEGIVAAYTTPGKITFNPKAMKPGVMEGAHFQNLMSMMGGHGRTAIDPGSLGGLATHEFGHGLYYSLGMHALDWIEEFLPQIAANPPSNYGMTNFAEGRDIWAKTGSPTARIIPYSETFAELFAQAKRYGQDPYGMVDFIKGEMPLRSQHVGAYEIKSILEAQHQAKLAAKSPFHKAGGGPAGGGMYIVGEIGDELFVPSRLAHLVPDEVMAQIPKAASGMQVIGRKRNELFFPPEDGVIIPHRLMSQVPRAADGIITNEDIAKANAGPIITGQASARGPVEPVRRGVRTEAWAKEAAAMEAATRALIDFAIALRAPSRALGTGHAGLLEAGPTAIPLGGPTTRPTGHGTIYGYPPGGPPPAWAIPPRAAPGAGAGAPPPGAPPWAAGFGWAGGGGAGRPFIPGSLLPPFSPLTKAAMSEAARLRAQRRMGEAEEPDPVLDRLRIQRAGVTTRMLARTPRVVASALGGLGLGGGEEFQRRQVAFQVAKEDYSTDLRKHQAAQEEVKEQKLTVALARRDRLALGASPERTNAVAEAKKELATRKDIEAKARANREESGKKLDDAATAAEANKGKILRSFSSIAFSVGVYGVAMQVANAILTPAMEGIAKGTQEFADELGGFSATSQRVTKVIGQSAVELGGNVQAAIAKAAGAGGLGAAGYAAAQQYLGGSTLAKGGGVSAQQGSDTRRAIMGAISGAPEGLYGGYGGLFGGALLGSELGGGKGSVEIMTKDLAAMTKAGFSADVSDYTAPGKTYGITDDVMTGKKPFPVSTEGKKYYDLRESTVKDYNEASTRYTSSLNKANDGTKLVMAANKDEEKAAIDNAQRLKDAGLASQDFVDRTKDLADAHYFLATADHKLVQSEQQATKFWQNVSGGDMLPTMEEYADQQKRALQAQEQTDQAAAEHAANVTIPGQFGLQLAAQPFIPAQAGILPSTGAGAVSGINVGGMNVGSLLATANAGQAELTKEAAAGIKDMSDFIASTPGLNAPTTISGVNYTSGQSAFDDFTKKIQASGQVIAGWQEKIAGAQANMQWAQYRNNLRLATRAHADALALAGKGGGKDGTMGAIERAQAMLGFFLSQLQINFRVAMAGFQAPGVTSEQRAANQAEARAEAAVAQRQLDLQKAGFTESASRGVVDTGKSIALLKQEQTTQVAIAAAQKVIAVEEQKVSLNQQKIQTIMGRAETSFSGALSAAGGYASQFGDSVQKATESIYKSLGYTVTYDKKGTMHLGAPADNMTGIPGKPYVSNAAGFLGSYAKGAMLQVGEAGPETVAILRNPRAMMMGGGFGGGGGGQTTVNLYLTVQGDVKDEVVVAKIQRAVEDAMNRKAARLGMRSFASSSS